ncbi:hypothetical protein HY638_02630 [Candidatus Woesearchaeota archaeon]|nr:hypothetical protein [Candidatus Woesearchaeota archaeon]
MQYTNKLEKEFGKIPEGWIVLLETDAESVLGLSLATIKLLTEKGYSGIIVSASRPCNNLLGIYAQHGIDAKRTYILDCVCKSQGIKPEAMPNVSYVENVTDLTSISIGVNDLAKKVEGKKFVFIDSVATMLIHNKPQVFAIFIHSILTKMRAKGISCLLTSIGLESEKDVMMEIAQLCDRVIKI